ncbi:MAG: type I-E CRISPR-associated protein Cse2/CasB [Shinella sp.]|nr:MAG: type I-E CRISPR-associated protein Cse2/CasB [Shinella sp.]
MSEETPSDILSKATLAWWRTLYPMTTGQRGNAGARAELRRAGTIMEVVMLPAFHDLLHSAQKKGVAVARLGDARIRRLALAVAVICERPDGNAGPRSFAQVLGAVGEGERPALSPLRFQSLMATLSRGDGDEELSALRRALTLVKDSDFNVAGLVRDLIDFTEVRRIRWTFDYYGTTREPVEDAGGDAPSETEETV